MKSIRLPKFFRVLVVFAVFAYTGFAFGSDDVQIDVEDAATETAQQLESDPEGFQRRLTKRVTALFSSADLDKDLEGKKDLDQSLVQRVKRAAEHSGHAGISLRLTGLAGFCCFVSAGFLYRQDYDAFLNAVRELLKDGATPENLATLQHLVDSADRTPLNLLIAGTVLSVLGL